LIPKATAVVVLPSAAPGFRARGYQVPEFQVPECLVLVYQVRDLAAATRIKHLSLVIEGPLFATLQ